MFLAALLDAGMPFGMLEERLRKLPLPHWSMRLRRVVRGAISATWLQVETIPEQNQRGLPEIRELICAADLGTAIEARALAMFEQLGRAEAGVHGLPLEKVHFHEVGAVDAILDLVGAAVGIEWLDAAAITVSPINVGSGHADTAHGRLAIPAPATLALVTAAGAPIYSGVESIELLTPTGAVILTSIADRFGSIPAMRPTAYGYGAGSANLTTPNVLRVVIGENSAAVAADSVIVLETNIDDSSAEVLGFAAERCLAVGALDVWMVPIQMKKFRPGTALHVICQPEAAAEIENMIFAETGTLGIRRRLVERRILDRQVETVDTAFGPIRIKSAGEANLISPEYEDVRRAALAHKRPIAEVMRAARRAAEASGENERQPAS
jgi:hypothetical protein